jgi:hypothetical protein
VRWGWPGWVEGGRRDCSKVDVVGSTLHRQRLDWCPAVLGPGYSTNKVRCCVGGVGLGGTGNKVDLVGMYAASGLVGKTENGMKAFGTPSPKGEPQEEAGFEI